MEFKQIFSLLWKVANKPNYDPPALFHPYGVTFSDERIILAEGYWPYSRLQTFNIYGKSTSSIGQGEILPFDLAYDNKSKTIFFTDHKDRTVKMYDSDFKLISWKEKMFEWPTGICLLNNKNVCVADKLKGLISIHDSDEREGTIIRKFSTIDKQHMQTFSHPAFLAHDHLHNRIVMTDIEDSSLKFFDKSGKLLLVSGGRNKGVDFGADKRGCIEDPRGVAVDSKGYVYVADLSASKIKVYSPSGIWIEDILEWKSNMKYNIANTLVGVQNPWGLSFGDSGEGERLIVSEHKLNEEPGLKMFARVDRNSLSPQSG